MAEGKKLPLSQRCCQYNPFHLTSRFKLQILEKNNWSCFKIYTPYNRRRSQQSSVAVLSDKEPITKYFMSQGFLKQAGKNSFVKSINRIWEHVAPQRSQLSRYQWTITEERSTLPCEALSKNQFLSSSKLGTGWTSS